MDTVQHLQEQLARFVRRLKTDEVRAIYVDPRRFVEIAQAHRVSLCTVGDIKARRRYVKLTADLGDAPKRRRGRPRKRAQ